MRYRTFYERYLLKIKKATGSVSFQSLINLIFIFLGRTSIPYHFSSFLGNKKGDREYPFTLHRNNMNMLIFTYSLANGFISIYITFYFINVLVIFQRKIFYHLILISYNFLYGNFNKIHFIYEVKTFFYGF